MRKINFQRALCSVSILEDNLEEYLTVHKRVQFGIFRDDLLYNFLVDECTVKFEYIRVKTLNL